MKAVEILAWLLDLGIQAFCAIVQNPLGIPIMIIGKISEAIQEAWAAREAAAAREVEQERSPMAKNVGRAALIAILTALGIARFWTFGDSARPRPGC